MKARCGAVHKGNSSMAPMRRNSAGYVKSVDEGESPSTSSTKRSWKKRLFSKKQSSKTLAPSAFERPLLLDQMGSSEDGADDIQPISSALSSQSETSSPVSSTCAPQEQRPIASAPPQDKPVRQEQSPQDQIVDGVKKKLNREKAASPPKPKAETTSPPTLPTTPPREKKTSDEMMKVRAALSRPFGRNSLPPHMASNWVVEVSPAEWDADEERWKYRILVQRRTLAELDDSMTTAFTWRSLADFVWLEQALRAEYHGGLLLPLLSIAIGTPDVVNFTQQDVDATLLKDWLNDVLNGIRGQGTSMIVFYG